MDDVVFTNVNEDGVAYDQHRTLSDALAVLQEFPNDSIVVTIGDYHGEWA